jgi:hypothetical protein
MSYFISKYSNEKNNYEEIRIGGKEHDYRNFFKRLLPAAFWAEKPPVGHVRLSGYSLLFRLFEKEFL